MADDHKTEPTLPTEQSRIIIKPGGEVIIENLSMSLLELAELLDPDAKLSCRLPSPQADSGDPEGEQTTEAEDEDE